MVDLDLNRGLESEASVPITCRKVSAEDAERMSLLRSGRREGAQLKLGFRTAATSRGVVGSERDKGALEPWATQESVMGKRDKRPVRFPE